jgi:hypothetical protein
VSQIGTMPIILCNENEHFKEFGRVETQLKILKIFGAISQHLNSFIITWKEGLKY